jgi:hypothetical protein
MYINIIVDISSWIIFLYIKHQKHARLHKHKILWWFLILVQCIISYIFYYIFFPLSCEFIFKKHIYLYIHIIYILQQLKHFILTILCFTLLCYFSLSLYKKKDTSKNAAVTLIKIIRLIDVQKNDKQSFFFIHMSITFLYCIKKIWNIFTSRKSDLLFFSFLEYLIKKIYILFFFNWSLKKIEWKYQQKIIRLCI